MGVTVLEFCLACFFFLFFFLPLVRSGAVMMMTGRGNLFLLPLLLFLYSTRMKMYRMDIEVRIRSMNQFRGERRLKKKRRFAGG